jgi:PAS domain S-box-containing protein
MSLLTIVRNEAPMTEQQEQHFRIRRRLSWIVMAAMVVAIGGLSWGFQSAQDRYDAARAKAEMWCSIIDHTPTAVIVTNGDGKIIAWNNGATRLFGWEDEDVIGSTTEFLMPCEELRARHREIWADEELKQQVFDGLILELVTDAAIKDGKVICVKGKVAGVTNAHKSFILHFYPNRRIRDQGTYSAKEYVPVPPDPLPPQAQHQMQKDQITEH